MCVNPFKGPKIPETPAAAPTPTEEKTQLTPKIGPEQSERSAVNAKKRGRNALLIPLGGSVPGGTGLSIPRP